MALTVLGLAGCGYPAPPTGGSGPVAGVEATTPTPSPGAFSFDQGADRTPVILPDGLKEVDLEIGTGDIVGAGDSVTVKYAGWLSDGTQFDANDGLCAILSATAQAQGACSPVIAGWNEGVPGMKVGGVRRLVIPPSLGYGSQPPQGSPIPANATLVFIVQVRSIAGRAAVAPSSSPSPSP